MRLDRHEPWAAAAEERQLGRCRRPHRAAARPLQVWLLLHNLLADGAARSRMDMSEARCEALLRLKRHFNELLLDQVWGGSCWLRCSAGVLVWVGLLVWAGRRWWPEEVLEVGVGRPLGRVCSKGKGKGGEEPPQA